MSSNQHENTGQKPGFFLALLIVVFAAVLILSAVQIFEQDVHIPLVLSAALAAAISMFILKVKWAVLEEGIITSIKMGMQACLILYTVGALIGSWIQTGTVPTMIYYGLSVLSPSIFLIATVLICSIVALSTGTSWGTSGTVGLALMGIGAGLGIPAPVCAGFVISGAYFGDKMSPLSDTTNLAPAMAGTDLFQHIRAMVWTTGPSYIIVLVIAGVFGAQYAGGSIDPENVNAIQVLIQNEFPISILMLLPPIVVIALSAAKKPAIPSIFAGILVSMVIGAIHGISFGDMMDALQNGYTPKLSGDLAEFIEDQSGMMAALAERGINGLNFDAVAAAVNTLNELLARGGLQSMNWTVSLIICALTFGGILECVGYLESLLNTLLKGVKSPGGLCTAVIISCVVSNMFTGDQYISLVLPGRMFKDRFKDAGLHPRMLSRSLEDSGTITSVLVPWNTCGAFHTTALGVPTIEYIPYACFNYINPIIAIIMTFLGIGISWQTKDGGFVISKHKPADA